MIDTPAKLQASYTSPNYHEWQVYKKDPTYVDSSERNKYTYPLTVSREENGKDKETTKEILDKFIDKGLFMSTINKNYTISAM